MAAKSAAKVGPIFVKFFKHWRSGKIIRAEDHGKKAFPIFPKRKK
jgi:hypothetical protein